jgi:hypothetical protein
MGLTGLEPVTLRLSSACSNQLSYRPHSAEEPPNFGFQIVDFRFGSSRAQARNSKISNRQSEIHLSAFVKATARQSSLWSTTRAKTGGKGIRTPDFQLAKLALYQLSYAPDRIFECRLPIFDCKDKSKMPNVILRFAIRHFATCFKRRYCVRPARRVAVFSLPYGPLTGTGKYDVLTLLESMALPVISPLLFMSLALSSRAEKPPLRSLRSLGVLP